MSAEQIGYYGTMFVYLFGLFWVIDMIIGLVLKVYRKLVPIDEIGKKEE